MHPEVRNAFLIILAQLARDSGSRRQLDLHPVTNDPAALEGFRAFFEMDPMPSRGLVVSFDLEVVSVDLDAVPLDEVLQFRDENRDAHRKYMENLRTFARSLNGLDAVDLQRVFADRQAHLEEQARTLRQLSWQAWQSAPKVGGFGLGLAGAAVSLVTGNPLPAAIGIASSLLGMVPDAPGGSPYSYLFKAKRSLNY